MAAFATPSAISADPGSSFQTLTALLALCALTGRQVGTLAADELLDAADDCDPDDAFLFRELEQTGQHLPELARYTDALVDAAFNVAAAFEQLMDGRFRTGLRAHADAALTPEAVALVAAAAGELSRQLGPDAVFVDSTPGGSDVLLGIIGQSGEERSPVFVTAQNDGDEARLVQRRLRVHGADHRSLQVDDSGAFELAGPAVHVCQYPSPASPGMAPMDMLLGIDNTLLQMDDAQRAVIVAPARVLCDAPGPGAGRLPSDRLRSDLLRSGRVRAVIRLPQGLVRSKPREAQALWVLGPSLAGVDIAERWTMVADLSGYRLTEDVVQDLIADIAASMGGGAAVRAHSFRFARLVFTRSLLAGQASLVSAAGERAPATQGSGAQAVLRADELLRLLAADPPPFTRHGCCPACSRTGRGCGVHHRRAAGSRDTDVSAGKPPFAGRPCRWWTCPHRRHCVDWLSGDMRSRAGAAFSAVAAQRRFAALCGHLSERPAHRTGRHRLLYQPAVRRRRSDRWRRRRPSRTRAADQRPRSARAASFCYCRRHQRTNRRREGLADLAAAARAGCAARSADHCPGTAPTRAARSPAAPGPARRTEYPD
ncbi:hypothetical protein [Paenarthrobacter sp. PH39-S1]|uniref:hypothetical protein n=1 Tax=Paenarthrobacter sp. PH39-S1 TaxID=3046204 RepID=UPI0024BACB92|nr:hypothetical protein [Paenarthrobacter sp. PH39-S1]MDJ0355462.1 hypothetical protein [Paenarthrobacter sp. PH39-S1]